ncbi:MAG: hypothetical protein K2X69_06995 [Silvanigrellaceae bacterium]|nr:hypothetical protein [Silvanigrellaceae bacterium]
MTNILINATNLAKEMGVSKPYISKLIAQKRLDFAKSVDSKGKVLYDLTQVLKVFSKKNTNNLDDSKKENDINEKINKNSNDTYSNNRNNNISSFNTYNNKHRARSSNGSNFHVRTPVNNTENNNNSDLRYDFEKTKKMALDVKRTRLKLLQEKKSLISSEEVEKEAFEIGRKVRIQLMLIPQRVCNLYSSFTDPHTIKTHLTKELINVLSVLNLPEEKETGDEDGV